MAINPTEIMANYVQNNKEELNRDAREFNDGAYGSPLGPPSKISMDTAGSKQSTAKIGTDLEDDITDEDAFRVIRERGKGVSIIVEGKEGISRPTCANYSLRNTLEVRDFLRKMSDFERLPS